MSRKQMSRATRRNVEAEIEKLRQRLADDDIERAKPRRRPCANSCDCLCHDVNGGPMHPGEPCPGKQSNVDA